MADAGQRLSDAIVDMDEDAAACAAREALSAGCEAASLIEGALVDGMDRAGDLYERELYFIPELLGCADAMQSALDVLSPSVSVGGPCSRRCRIVIGTIEGDTHDIGKNVVSLLVGAGGFEVRDLGRDVPPAEFVRQAREFDADIIAISTLMTTTMGRMREVVDLLEGQGLRDSFRVIVGGRPVSAAFARRIGADGYSDNAAAALRLVRRIAAALPSSASSAAFMVESGKAPSGEHEDSWRPDGSGHLL